MDREGDRQRGCFMHSRENQIENETETEANELNWDLHDDEGQLKVDGRPIRMNRLNNNWS